MQLTAHKTAHKESIVSGMDPQKGCRGLKNLKLALKSFKALILKQ